MKSKWDGSLDRRHTEKQRKPRELELALSASPAFLMNLWYYPRRTENLNGYVTLIQSGWINDLLFLPFFAPEKCFAVNLANAEIRLQPLHRVFHSTIHMGAHRLGSLCRIARHDNIDEIGMRPSRVVRLRTRHTKPRRCQRVRFLNRETQGRTARAFGNSPMEFFMRRQIQRLFRYGHGVDSCSELDELTAILFGRDGGEEHRGLNFESFANNVVTPHIFARWYANARARSRPAFQQTFELQAQKSFGNRQETHAELSGNFPS